MSVTASQQRFAEAIELAASLADTMGERALTAAETGLRVAREQGKQSEAEMWEQVRSLLEAHFKIVSGRASAH